MTAASAAEGALFAVLAFFGFVVAVGAWLVIRHHLRAQVGPETPATERQRKQPPPAPPAP